MVDSETPWVTWWDSGQWRTCLPPNKGYCRDTELVAAEFQCQRKQQFSCASMKCFAYYCITYYLWQGPDTPAQAGTKLGVSVTQWCSDAVTRMTEDKTDLCLTFVTQSVSWINQNIMNITKQYILKTETKKRCQEILVTDVQPTNLLMA